MKASKPRRLSSFVGLFGALGAAWGCDGSDGLVTVGVRPTDTAAAVSSSVAGGASGRSARETAETATPLDAGATPPQRVSSARPTPAFAGTLVTAGSGQPAEGRRSEPASSPRMLASAGSGGLGVAAGTGGAPARSEDECGAIPTQAPEKATSGRVNGAGLIEYDALAPNMFVALRTTLAVPVEPPPSGQVYIWSGLQPLPNGVNFQPIGTGALMPVLTWGPSCPSDAPASYSTWWIAPMYSNISSSDPQFSGCRAGKVTLAQPKQLIDIELQLEGTRWNERVVNRDTMEMSVLMMDLKGQAQGRTFFNIELLSNNKPTEDIVFTNTVLTMDVSDPSACEPVLRGSNDYAAKARVSADGKRCCIDRIVLRAAGVMPTTQDPP